MHILTRVKASICLALILTMELTFSKIRLCLIRAAIGICDKYVTEYNKGRNLAPFVGFRVALITTIFACEILQLRTL
jgi:hypothetical protein